MRTREKVQRGMWSYVADEDRIPKDHPLRAMRALIAPVLRDLSPRFSQLYASNGRASIPPEYLLRALIFRDERRSNETHASRTDPDARLVKKARGQASHLGYHGHVLMENRNGLVAQATLTIASGRAEQEAALALVDRLRNRGRITLGADKGYDVADFIAQCREREVTPHVACTSDPRRSSAIDGRTTRHPGYVWSQRKRKRVEEIFGWLKTVGALPKTRHRGRDREDWIFTFAAAAFNLTRIRNLIGAAA